MWEIAIKESLGRLKLPEPVSAAASRLGVRPLPVTFAHAEEAGRLPRLHRDPFDRMLIAQARIESLTVMTYDPALLAYEGASFLRS